MNTLVIYKCTSDICMNGKTEEVEYFIPDEKRLKSLVEKVHGNGSVKKIELIGLA